MAKILPEHLLAKELSRIGELMREATTIAVGRKQGREVTLLKWQELWDLTTKVVWTCRMIPDILDELV